VKALVTGGAGFIGSHLTGGLLEQGWSVTVLDDLSTGRKENLPRGARFVRGDVRDVSTVARLVRGQDYVFHLAAQVGNLLSIGDPRTNMDINVGGSLCVFEAARKAGVRRVVYAASSAGLGEAVRIPQAEDHPAAPMSPYGVSKLAAEQYGLSLYQVHGFPFVAVRFFNVYGPRQGSTEYGNVIPIFFRRLRAGQALRIFGDGKQTRDFTYVGDIVQALTKAATAPGAEGQVFHVGTGTPTDILTLATVMQDVMAIHTGTFHEPARKGEVRNSLADISKARRILGFEPRFSLEEGLRLTVEHLRTLEEPKPQAPAPRASRRPRTARRR